MEASISEESQTGHFSSRKPAIIMHLLLT